MDVYGMIGIVIPVDFNGTGENFKPLPGFHICKNNFTCFHW